MELKLRNGDYQADGAGALVRAQGQDALLERVRFLLTARRGGFAPLPRVGSRLHLLWREKPSLRETAARQYVAEALEGEEVEAAEVTLQPLSDGVAALCVTLRTAQGETSLRVETEEGGTHAGSGNDL